MFFRRVEIFEAHAPLDAAWALVHDFTAQSGFGDPNSLTCLFDPHALIVRIAVWTSDSTVFPMPGLRLVLLVSASVFVSDHCAGNCSCSTANKGTFARMAGLIADYRTGAGAE
jgi:hypothetical protein